MTNDTNEMSAQREYIAKRRQERQEQGQERADEAAGDIRAVLASQGRPDLATGVVGTYVGGLARVAMSAEAAMVLAQRAQG